MTAQRLSSLIGSRRQILRWFAAASPASLAACSRTTPVAPDATPPRPALVVPVRVSAGLGPAFVGEVRAVRRAEPGFAVNGVVADVLVRPGDSVRVGQVLARLDATPLLAQRQAAQAEEAKARALRDEARRRSARVDAAEAAGATSPGESGAARSELAAADAALRSASTQHELATWAWERATLRATIDGMVGARHVEPGQSVSAGTPAFAIDGTGRELAVLLPGQQRVSVGQAALVSRPGQSISARVLQVASRLDAGGLRRVHLSVPDDAAVGDTWAVQLTDPTRPVALQVPARAVVRLAAPDQGSVLRLAADGVTVERATVSLGQWHQDAVEVLSGLSDKDRIVLAGASGIQPGTRVKPVDAALGATS